MNTLKKILLSVSFYLFSIGLSSAITINPSLISPNTPYNIQAYVVYENTLEPVTDATVLYRVISGTNVNCTLQSYPENQRLNYMTGAIYCTGVVCDVESGNDPNSPSSEGLYTVCVNASKPGFRSSYNSNILNVNSSAALCGNGVIDSGENCRTCPADAGCFYGQICCSDNTCKSSCVTSGCNNNGICDSLETCDCGDCLNEQDGCITGEGCSPYTNKCGCRNSTQDGTCPLPDSVCRKQDPDCVRNDTWIDPWGDPSYIRIIWNSSAMTSPPSTIGMTCFLNCDPRYSFCGNAQNCTYIGPSLGASCKISDPPPAYNYDDYNLIVCKLFDPATNWTYGYLSYTFKPYDVDIIVSSFSTTVGQDIGLPVIVKNIGLFTDAYQVNTTPTNLIYMPYTSLFTETLYGIPLINVQQLSFNMKVLAISDTPIGIIITANSTTNPKYGKQVFLQLRSGSASLPEFDIYGVLQILLFSSMTFAFLVWKKK